MDIATFIGIFISHLLLKVSAQYPTLSPTQYPTRYPTQYPTRYPTTDGCKDVVFTCNCGRTENSIEATFKQCFYLISKEEACKRFDYCLECDPNTAACATCPPNRHGKYCSETCDCKNGEKCDKETGQCTCESGNCREEVLTVTTTAGGGIKFCPRENKVFFHGIKEYIISETTINNPVGSFPPNTIIKYTCETFYEIKGRSQRKCRPDGTWSGIVPRCIPECGISPKKIPTIINGVKTTVEEWPWQVGLAFIDSFYIFCGGTLISVNWVITAAHCVVIGNNTSLRPKHQFKILFGKSYRSVSGDSVQERNVENIIIYWKFNPVSLDNDIALIEVKPITLTKFVRPVCLTTNDISQRNVQSGKLGIITGWGKDESGRISQVLKVTNLSIVSITTCQNANDGLQITDSMFCAGTPDGRSPTDSCRGDSGGPMVFPVQTEGKTRWYLEGIISWGDTEGCATPNKFSGFVRVSRFIEWIYFSVPE